MGFVYQQDGFLVTNLASQRCAHRQRLFDRALGTLPVSLQSIYQFLSKGSGACGQQFDGVKQVKCHYRHHHVEFEVPGGRTPDDDRVIANHLRANHQQALGDHRIDLARHDARSGLDCRQLQLSQSTTRPGAEPPDVVRNLGQSNCVRAQGAAQEAGCVARCLRFEVVASFDEWQSGSARDLNNSALGEPRQRI
jgi:hypothetical protein